MTTADTGLVAALARAQADFLPIAKSHENPHYKSKYADLADVLAAVKPALSAQGIALMQPLRTDDDGRVRLYTVLAGHGETIEACLPVHLDNMTPQQLLSTLTYYRRGMLASMLAVAAEDDDDGNAAQTAPQARQAAPATVDAPEDWETRPLATMTFTELRAVAAKLEHPFSGGSKAELIRQLEPLVRSRTGEEPFEVTTNAAPKDGAAGKTNDQPKSITFNPVLAGAATVRRGVDSAIKARGDA